MMRDPYLFNERVSPDVISVRGKEEDLFAYYPPKPDLRIDDFLVTKSHVLQIKLPSGWMCTAVLKIKDARQNFGGSPNYKGTFFTDDDDDTPIELQFKLTDIELKHLVRSPFGQSSLNPEWIKSDNALKWISTDETLRNESKKYWCPPFYEKAYLDCLETGYIREDGFSGYGAFVQGGVTIVFYTEQIDQLEYWADNDTDSPIAVVAGNLPTGYTHTIMFDYYHIECFARFLKTPTPIKKQCDDYRRTFHRLEAVLQDEESLFEAVLKGHSESWRIAFKYRILKDHFKSQDEKYPAKAARNALGISESKGKYYSTMMTDDRYTEFQAFFTRYKIGDEAKEIIAPYGGS